MKDSRWKFSTQIKLSCNDKCITDFEGEEKECKISVFISASQRCWRDNVLLDSLPIPHSYWGHYSQLWPAALENTSQRPSVQSPSRQAPDCLGMLHSLDFRPIHQGTAILKNHLINYQWPNPLAFQKAVPILNLTISRFIHHSWPIPPCVKGRTEQSTQDRWVLALPHSYRAERHF